jgi:carbamoyl-phosphate synthase large subunit
MKVADEVCILNVKDKEAVLKAARQKSIQAILTDQLDAGVLTAAYVAENMGIKGITSEVALKFTNKFIMRQAAKDVGINVPVSVCVSDMEHVERALAENPELKFPLMMKPVDSAASKGVYKVNSIREISEKIKTSKNYSASGEVILEQFVEGQEFVVEAFTRDYEVTNLVVGHRDYFQIPGTFIPNATVFLDAESANSKLEERLKETNKKLVEGYGLNFGITHGEYMYNPEEDKIYLVEIAARGGGVFISSDLIPGASSVDANDLLVCEALGIDKKKKIQIKRGSSAYFCYLTPEGKVISLNNTEKINGMTGVIRAFFDNIEIGMVSKSITDKSSRKGPILVKGTTKQDCYDIIGNVKEILDIKVESEDEIKDVIWH